MRLRSCSWTVDGRRVCTMLTVMLGGDSGLRVRVKVKNRIKIRVRVGIRVWVRVEVRAAAVGVDEEIEGDPVWCA